MKKTFVIVAASSLVVWLSFQFLLTAPSADSVKEVFVITRGQSVAQVAKALQAKGFIRNDLVFKIYVQIAGLSKNIQAGDFKLSKNMSADQVAEELTHGLVDVWVTLLEGWRVEEMAQKLHEEVGIDDEEFLKAASEGYMFPDTYLIPRTATAEQVVRILRDNFDQKTQSLKLKLATRRLSEKDWVILASIVERESKDKGDNERKIIAGIILKRLKAGMPLEADATIQYALGFDEREKTWWRKGLTSRDLQIDSPYNTRQYAGLTPGPIANPGLASLEAVVNPMETQYWFYLHDKQGNPHYATTIDEHVANIRRYL
ncbi:endolytic transglycosylase MltG [Candidatus Daviesbacteria bacterium]|nr:endolytic transglycosylase MltG [Candidatus Daviesbacteria bacterium]